MDYMNYFVLSLLQGITEFLPVSSSAHLLVPGILFDWPDQGLAYDIAVHLGTLLAAAWYFRKDLAHGFIDSIEALRRSGSSESSGLIFHVVIATLPITLVGFFFMGLVEQHLRHAWIVAICSLTFGLLLGFVWLNRLKSTRETITLYDSLFIGCAQCFAIIPGVSRSGITITAGLYLGLRPASAARFSFILAIPTIFGATILGSNMLIENEIVLVWHELLFSVCISAISAYLTIGLFLSLIDRIGLMPFIIYRILLSLALGAFLLG